MASTDSLISLTVDRTWVDEGVPGARTMADGSKFKFTLKRSGNLSSSVYADLDLHSSYATVNEDYVAALYTYESGNYRAVSGGAKPRVTLAANKSEVDLYLFIWDNTLAESDEQIQLDVTAVGVSSGGGAAVVDSSKRYLTVTIKDDDTNRSPVVNDSVASKYQSQTATTGNYYVWTVPSDMFIDPDGDLVKNNALLKRGEVFDDLPSWLHFDGSSFYGTPGADVANAKYEIAVTGYDGKGGITYTTFNLEVKAAATVKDDYGSTIATASSYAVQTSKSGNIETAGDKDFFAISMVSGTEYTFVVDDIAPTSASLTKPVVTLFGADGSRLTSKSADSDSTSAILSYTPKISTTYYLSVEGANSATGTYSITSYGSSETSTPANEFRGALSKDPFKTITEAQADDFAPKPGKKDGDVWYTSRDPSFSRAHVGEDWNYEGNSDGDKGMPILSIGKGIVVNSNDGGKAWGNHLVIKYNLGHDIYIEGKKFSEVYAIYAHMQDTPTLKKDDTVEYGQQIGKIGNTTSPGSSVDYHLHLGIATSAEAVRGLSEIASDDKGNFLADNSVYHSKTKKWDSYYIKPSYFIENYNNGNLWEDDFISSATFSPSAYAAENPDLLKAFAVDPDALVKHYLTAGRQEGRISSGFDANAYAAKNPDLFAAFGLDATKLAQHYISYGKNEERTVTGFNPYAYAAFNPDLLSAFGTNTTALVQHYISAGSAENRLATGFDPYAYAAKNPDLFNALGTNIQALVSHYAAAGYKEGRQKAGFDPYAYAALNPDLFSAFGTNVNQLIRHYVTSGMAEGRLAS